MKIFWGYNATRKNQWKSLDVSIIKKQFLYYAVRQKENSKLVYIKFHKHTRIKFKSENGKKGFACFCVFALNKHGEDTAETLHCKNFIEERENSFAKKHFWAKFCVCVQYKIHSRLGADVGVWGGSHFDEWIMGDEYLDICGRETTMKGAALWMYVQLLKSCVSDSAIIH
jgi:hypothetical protein